MTIIGVIAATLLSLSCVRAPAGAVPPPQRTATPSPGDASQVVTEVPLRMEIPVTPEVEAAVRALRAGQPEMPTIRLTLEGVRADGDSAGLRVYVGVTHGELSIDDPSFVGSVAFGHSGPFETAPTDSFLLNIAAALSRIAVADRLISGPSGHKVPVTLVLRPSDSAAKPTAIHIRRVTLSVPAR